MNDTDPLAQLKDIHMPEPLLLWVPAPGWWLLATLLLVLLFYITKILLKKIKHNRYRKLALAELQTAANIDNPTELLIKVNHLLKRVAISAFGAASCASLKGSEWMTFLDQTQKTKVPVFTKGAGKILNDGQYRPQIEFNKEELLSIVRQWIKNHSRHVKPGKNNV